MNRSKLANLQAADYEVECPEAYDSDYECGEQCYFVPILEPDGDDTIIVGWRLCCSGCPDDMYCSEPIEEVSYLSKDDAIALGGVSMPCVPYESIFGGATQLRSLASPLIGAGVRGLLRVQCVDRPNAYRAVGVSLSAPVSIIAIEGWKVIFTRLPDLGEQQSPFPLEIEAMVLPPQLPRTGLSPIDKFRTATVILPEADGLNQYMITVPESAPFNRPPYLYSQLITREWAILLLRNPITRRKDGEPDCGCKEKSKNPISVEPLPE